MSEEKETEIKGMVEKIWSLGVKVSSNGWGDFLECVEVEELLNVGGTACINLLNKSKKQESMLKIWKD